MDPNEKPSRELGDFSDVARPLTVGGKTYMLAPLQVGDIAARQAVMKAVRRSALLNTLRRTPLNDGIVASALAHIEVASVTIANVFDDVESRSELTRLSLERGGSSVNITHLAPGDATELWLGVLWVSGLGDEKDGVDPFDDTTGTPTK